MKVKCRYTPACARLIAQFKTALNLVHNEVNSVEDFMKEYKVLDVFIYNSCLQTHPYV
jgi:hypothetical protein